MYKTYPDSQHVFTSSIDIHNYIHGGRGIVTLEAPSGKSHSYYFKRPSEKDTFPDNVIFVHAAHNNEKFFYIGMIEDNRFRLTKNSRYLPDNEIVKGARYIMRMAKDQDLVEKTLMTLYHEGMCARCGRPLTDEKSIARGFGRKCANILKEHHSEGEYIC